MVVPVLFYCSGIDLSRWRELLNEKGTEANLDKFAQQVHGNHFIPNTVLVDCTADSAIASHYYDWLRKGIHVITPNKKANSGPLDQVTYSPHLITDVLVLNFTHASFLCVCSVLETERSSKEILHSLLL